ncbi:hypothetical protein TraAM80_02487 [Trypanosoma rangeli]|uniref:Uncharacterized protein n=1 Tax=Trypanosoma rangeli TaxID=5698 RepID=A0A3R7NWL6_TRYRA|nr:uncharacterized protein TraAM80_02487 [Trypanosoma rangeli]RNF08854.1 hypothetical protein TraAM80_02487 [Trypanosoma rangeli]|eukprot:RNF08854.1 hypothetical protein TraAM80_02487 [Trypanosoma rangeli]
MPKRSRSVLHAYLLPPSKCLHDDKGKKCHASLASKATVLVAPVTDAADNEVALHDCDSGPSAAAFVVSDATNHVPRKLSEGWRMDVDEGVLLDEPFIPEADRLVGLPPSCRAVQGEPNWLERALMLARCPSRCRNGFYMNGDSERFFCLVPPEPTCLHPAGTTQEEQCHAAAVASIAAAFYAAPRPDDSSFFFNAPKASRAH